MEIGSERNAPHFLHSIKNERRENDTHAKAHTHTHPPHTRAQSARRTFQMKAIRDDSFVDAWKTICFFSSRVFLLFHLRDCMHRPISQDGRERACVYLCGAHTEWNNMISRLTIYIKQHLANTTLVQKKCETRCETTAKKQPTHNFLISFYSYFSLDDGSGSGNGDLSRPITPVFITRDVLRGSCTQAHTHTHTLWSDRMQAKRSETAVELVVEFSTLWAFAFWKMDESPRRRQKIKKKNWCVCSWSVPACTHHWICWTECVRWLVSIQINIRQHKVARALSLGLCGPF